LSYFKGVCDVPELKRLGFKFSYESHGKSLVDDCEAEVLGNEKKYQKPTTRKKQKQEKEVIEFFERDQITRSSPNEEAINKTKFLKLRHKNQKHEVRYKADCFKGFVSNFHE